MDTKKPHNEVTKPGFKLRSLLTLHRRMGVVSALFVILLSFSGLILHQGQTMGLGTRFINSSAMLSWYGIEIPQISRSFATANHQVSLVADALYFDTLRLPGTYSDLQGLVATEFGYIVASSNQLLLLTGDAELIEVLGALHGVPAGIIDVGFDAEKNVFLRLNEGVFLSDVERLSWTLSDLPAEQIQWSESEPVSPVLAESIRENYGSTLLSWERLFLDIHSGRLLGGFGVILVDIMALLFILMAATGIWIWTRRKFQ